MAELTFLMNDDPSGTSNRFYHFAKKFFTAAGAIVVDAPAGGQTLEGVFAKLNAINKEQTTINLVSHATGFAAMECPLTNADKTAGRRSMNEWDMEEALRAKSLSAPNPTAVTAKTRIVIYGCDIGRSEGFMIKLSALFGNPAELLAPKRMGLFVLDGTKVKYQQAQTWSLVRKAPLIAGSTGAPAGGWDAFRNAFVEDAKLKFGDLANKTEAIGEDHLKSILTGIASTATHKIAPAYFFEEGVEIGPSGTETAAQRVASMIPLPNGDPVKANPTSIHDVDDRTLVTIIKGSDAYKLNPAGTRFRISVILLGKILDDEVLIAEGPGYHQVTTLPARAPATGPKPAGGGSGGGSGSGSGAGSGSSPVSEFQTVLDELLAAGATQAEVDALIADIPEGDAAEGLVLDAPDEPDATDEPTAPRRVELS